MIGFGHTLTNEAGLRYVQQAYNAGELGQGMYVKEFERQLTARLGSHHGTIAVNNGTLADQLCIQFAIEHARSNIDGAPSEVHPAVICPALTFVAQPNAAIAAGAVPIFCDVGDDGLIDPQSAAEAYEWAIGHGWDVVALYPADLNGRRADIQSLEQLATKPLLIIEDACEAFGTAGAGRLAHLATFSFFASHALGIGEGGAIMNNHSPWADYAIRSALNHGRVGETLYEKFTFGRYATNGKMNNLTAAAGAGALLDFNTAVARRRRNYNQMAEAAGTLEVDADTCPHAFQLFFGDRPRRDAALARFYDAGIDVRPFFNYMPTIDHLMLMARQPLPCTKALHLADTGLYLPCHAGLAPIEVEKICEAIKLVCSKEGVRA